MAVVPSIPLFFATAALPAPAKRTAFEARRCTPLSRLPVLSFPSHPSDSRRVSDTYTSARTSLRAAAAAQKYVYPDPIPEFAETETEKFKTELWRKLYGEIETFGDDLDAVVDICSQVEPFTDMMVALKDENLPGAAFAARAALLWAQNYVDRDWESWNAARTAK
ncbi:protein PLASTID REDOX INSENSITIVE 2, chloroplastic-like isoform X2 [Punica granatum]|uniref:Protein PLASTID REDOX INSENSITIVE 2, chloroplastic-like isoform X2 n=1 Tax=Punica granatum TaxID=22663 RepID=A0A6P8D4H9_PUNGR|nr:protein PLASTID REDOX INSENSITIVE 2, chloroplastic-like isoform X2 [Punica granatum]